MNDRDQPIEKIASGQVSARGQRRSPDGAVIHPGCLIVTSTFASWTKAGEGSRLLDSTFVHPVSGGILRRQQRELCPRARADSLDRAAEGSAGGGVEDDFGGLPLGDSGQLGFLEVRLDRGIARLDQGKDRLARRQHQPRVERCRLIDQAVRRRGDSGHRQIAAAAPRHPFGGTTSLRRDGASDYRASQRSAMKRAVIRSRCAPPPFLAMVISSSDRRV